MLIDATSPADPAAAPTGPRPGDVIVQPMDDAPLVYGLGVYPCALQQACGTYEQAVCHGIRLARRFAVALWRQHPDGTLLLLAWGRVM